TIWTLALHAALPIFAVFPAWIVLALVAGGRQFCGGANRAHAGLHYVSGGIRFAAGLYAVFLCIEKNVAQRRVADHPDDAGAGGDSWICGGGRAADPGSSGRCPAGVAGAGPLCGLEVRPLV